MSETCVSCKKTVTSLGLRIIVETPKDNKVETILCENCRESAIKDYRQIPQEMVKSWFHNRLIELKKLEE